MTDSSLSAANASICAMPTEILLQIFSYLPAETTAYVVPKVCTRWKKLYTGRSFYRDLRFSGDVPSTQEIVFILNNLAKNLTSLTLVNRRDGDAILQTVGPNSKHMKSLKVVNCTEFTADKLFFTSSTMLRIAFYCTGLQELRLKNTKTLCRPAFFKHLVHLGQLTNFKPGIPYHPFIDLDITAIVATHIREIEHLRLFHGKHDEFSQALSHESLLTLTDKHKNSLKTLKMNCSTQSNESMAAVASCKRLTSLGLHYLLNVDDEGIRHLGDLNLTRIHVGDNGKVSPQAWVDLFARDGMRGLVKLTFTMCKHVDDSVLKAIGESLKRLKLLRIFECGSVTYEGRRRISELLPSCHIISVPQT